ncbi:YHS domain-containing (seleno)protein [Methylibium sp.]|uniref:YHS domain-containing (seleno)protein n=1 Tax=Methylibium sp. TaxID=2067992 RepID=UPI003D11BE95
MNTLRRHLLLAVAATLAPLAALAAGPANLDARGVAIHGHDPVAYFVESKAVMGKAEYSAIAGAATYWFASEANQQLFKADPAKYEPQYGGYCAYGVAQGYKPDIDPTAFRIVDGKLYLNLSPAVQKRWQADIPGFIDRASQNWTSLKGQ